MEDAFLHRRRVLFGDCDPGGVLYTPRAAHFIVEAGLDFLRERLGGPPERMLFEAGIAPPARAMSVEFVAPMTWDDQLDIHVNVAQIRDHALVLGFDGRVDGRETLKGELTLVCVSTQNRRPVPVPEWLRESLLPAGG